MMMFEYMTLQDWIVGGSLAMMVYAGIIGFFIGNALMLFASWINSKVLFTGLVLLIISCLGSLYWVATTVS